MIINHYLSLSQIQIKPSLPWGTKMLAGVCVLVFGSTENKLDGAGWAGLAEFCPNTSTYWPRAPVGRELTSISLRCISQHHLTHLPLMPHICICEPIHHWFRWWIVAWSAPSHYLNHCWNIVNCALRNKLQWTFNQYSCFFIQRNAFENVLCKMAAILSRERWENSSGAGARILQKNNPG